MLSSGHNHTVSLKENFLWNATFQLLRIITPIITMPYLARVLGPDHMGLYGYTYAIANYFSLFAILGLNQYGNREIAKVKHDRILLSKVFFEIYIMQVVTGLLTSSIYILYSLLIAQDRTIALIWFFWVGFEVLDINWLFFGLEEFRITVIRSTIIRIVLVIGIFTLVHSESDLWLYTLLQALSYGVGYIVLWPFVPQRVDFILPSLQSIVKHIKPNLLLFAPVMAISLYTQLDKVLLRHLTDAAQVGFYDNSEKICQVPLSLISALGTVMLPRISSLIVTGKRESIDSYLSKSVWASSMMSWAFCLGVFAVAPEFAPVYFGNGYESCSDLMRGLSFMIPIVALSNVFGVQCLIPLGMDRQYTYAVVTGALVNLFGNLILIPRIGTMGAVYSTLLAEGSVTIMQAWFIRKVYPIMQYICEGIPFSIIGFVMFLSIRFIVQFLSINAFGLFIEIIFGAIVYAVLVLAWLMISKDNRLSTIIR